jgi:hypothetical protein
MQASTIAPLSSEARQAFASSWSGASDDPVIAGALTEMRIRVRESSEQYYVL